MRALALLSGGLDSIVATWAAREEYSIVAAITFDYGQRARAREIAAAREVAAQMECSHIVIELPWLGKLGQSALTDASVQVPQLDADQLDDEGRTRDSAAVVWVPNRNGVFLNIAAAYAEARDCGAIVCGFNREEAATFPDNSRDFMQVADRFFALSTRRHPTVVSPTVGLDKSEIATLARDLRAPIGHVWSCYFGEERHCWKCESCQRLKRALDSAGLWGDWLDGRFGGGPR